MDKSEIRATLLSLSQEERVALLSEIENEPTSHSLNILGQRREHLDNKIGCCPRCSGKKYRKHGKDKGSQRYYCNSCKKTFTEYTGTWLAGIHKKELITDYLKLMEQELSLDKIKDELEINKKTAFDWRHKILSGLENIDQGGFKGITESDDTFFLHSSKGSKLYDRKPRKRGGSAKKKGISNEQVAVIVTADRDTELDLSVVTFGRIKKSDITQAIGQRVSDDTILCSDSHVSYKGFAIDNDMEHHAIRADLKQYVKQKIYHVQHVNSIDSRLKKWLEYQFGGVSTKYLQKYLNWFKTKERLKQSKEFLKDFTNKSLIDITARNTYMEIGQNYQDLINTTLN
ncbi:MAG: IS1595 family transposase [Bacteroidetes bacterium]|jgi:transposase-like protein|nr:IS1595 family transposase [Bacteroidota bacterium]